jgi:hypothetical protein
MNYYSREDGVENNVRKGLVFRCCRLLGRWEKGEE